MPKRTIQDLCDKHGITKSQWQAAKTAGINTWNDKEMGGWLATRRPRIAKDAKLDGDDPLTIAPDSTPEQAIEQIERRLMFSVDHTEIKILSDKLKGLMQAVKIRSETRELVSRGEMQNSATRVHSAARAELLKLASDIPPRLEGLGAAKMQTILKTAITEILTRLSNESSKCFE